VNIRRVLLPLHLVGGLISAVFLALLGASGSLVAFENEIDHWLNGPLTWVQPQGAPLSLGELSARMRQRHPESRVSNITLPADPRIAYGIHMRPAGKGKPSSFAVNPYTGEELGSLDTANTFTRKVHQFHTNLLLGPRGKLITAASAIILLGLSISGLILWMPAKLWKPGVLARKNAGSYELHNVAGIYASVFMLIFAGTGIVIHWDDETRAIVDRLAGHADKPQPKRVSSPRKNSPPLGPDQLLAVAVKAVPGAKVTSIQGIGGGSPVRITMKYPEDRTPAGRTNLYIDASTGDIVSMQTSRTAPIGTRVAKLWNREIHTGDIGGLPTRILACIASLSLPLLAITGPLMWLGRLRRKRAALRSAA
jgi:uncharacterized iron-regulated membrane protein